MKRPGKAGGKAADVRRPKAAGRKRRAVAKAKSQPRLAAGLHEQLERNKKELNEALQQQAATSEVLHLISAAPGDLKRVFAVILESATRLCQANFGTLYLAEGDFCRAVAMHNAPPAFTAFRSREPLAPITGTTVLARVAKTKRTIQVADMAAEAASYKNPQERRFVKLTRVRSLVTVPMLKDNELIGMITVYRQEVRPFSEAQVDLLTSFAAQAVIAIENTRLLSELRQRTEDLTESLEQQIATADVLKVISRSTFDLQVVLETLIELAARLCRADKASFRLARDDFFHHVASYGYTAKQHRYMIEHPVPAKPDRGSTIGRILPEGKAVQIVDTKADPEFRMTNVLGFENVHTTLGVPLLREGRPIGVLVLMRSRVERFTEKQIELVTTFADQAVIAVENVRLFEAEQQRTRELTESLEQQTATAEVLSVISSSPGELEPVFQAMLENATRICEAKFGTMYFREGDGFRAVAMYGAPPAYVEARLHKLVHPGPNTSLGRAVATKRVVQIEDAFADSANSAADPMRVAAVDLGGVRTLLSVPLLKDNELVGAISIYRQEVRRFTDKQTALVQNFAAQAVIAIENTRLLNELRQSLEQQTATADVLQVISSSPGDLAPVFQSMLENATRICEAKFGSLLSFDGEMFELAAEVGTPPEFGKFMRQRGPFSPVPGSLLERVLQTKRVSHTIDYAAESVESPAVRFGGARSTVDVPMLKDGALAGVISIYRQEVRPFSVKQIALLTNFAAQAVIAIENTRLLSELRQSLEQQTATADVLRVISSSPGELDPVFNAMLANAVRICDAKFGVMFRYDRKMFDPAATFGVTPEYAEFLKQRGSFEPRAGSGLDRLLQTKEVIRIADDAAGPSAGGGPSALSGARSRIVVPMLKDAGLVGAITIYRQEMRPFNDKQVELVQNFAAQAVIAIENTRLLNELRQSLEQQTATADVLRVISSSPGELEPVFQAMLENATRICEAKIGILFKYEDGAYTSVSLLGVAPAYAEYLTRGPIRPGPETGLGRVASTRQTIQIADTQAEQAYADREPFRVATAELGGARSLLNVPMLKESELIGAIGIYRQEVRPFSEKQIALITNFADQAVIAIENTRLLNELRQRTDDLTESLEQQTATSEVLSVISSSPGALEPVFQAMLENAVRICQAKFGFMLRYDGEAYHTVASLCSVAAYSAEMRRGPIRPDADSALGLVAKTGQVAQIADIMAHRLYAERNPLFVAGAELGGIRTIVVVPMLKDNMLIGAITIFRQEVRPFTDKQIELVQNFAAQAVIAIENTRLLGELRQRTDDLTESLSQQTATSEVLKVISRVARRTGAGVQCFAGECDTNMRSLVWHADVARRGCLSSRGAS